MSATNPAVLNEGRHHSEPLLGRIMATVLFAILLVALTLEAAVLATVSSHAPQLLFWATLILLMNLLPVTVDDVQLTMDLPLLLAVAMLYGPEAAAVVGFAATVDARQASHDRVSLWRSLFNRSQIALSILVAGEVFSMMSPGPLPLSRSIPALAAALVADYLVNTGAVAVHVSVTRRIALSESTKQLVEHPLHFIATYFGYAALSLILAMLFQRVGWWSVVAFVIPLVGARQLLLRGQDLERLAEDLRRHERLLREALYRLDRERGKERLRVAADLHDDVLQNVIHVRMLGSLLEKDLDERSKRPRRADLEAARELRLSADGAIERLRAVISGLSTSELDSTGLVATIRHLLERLQREWRVTIVASLPPDAVLDKDLQLVVFQTVREAVLNALKHSGADRVDVSLEISPEGVRLEVCDDGAGFLPDQETQSKDRHFGLGLLRSRVEAVSGEVAIQSFPGTGTRLRAYVPLRGGQ